jgi:hypothetical protein
MLFRKILRVFVVLSLILLDGYIFYKIGLLENNKFEFKTVKSQGETLTEAKKDTSGLGKVVSQNLEDTTGSYSIVIKNFKTGQD